MKILFVHLSDLHITPDFEVNTTKTDKLIAAIKSKMSDVDECILICSGDVANTANKNEYKVARKFFGKIINSLGAEIDKFIRLMIVPGNHDLLLPKGSRSSEEILSYYKDGSLMEKYNEELTRNEGFFEYATSKNCFKDSKVIGVKSIIFNDFRIQFNLINTSPFSTLEPVDKQVHYLSSTELRKLERRSDASLVITIMHHSPEWFYYESKIEFENLLFNNSDIIFIGHEHTPKLEGISCRNQRIKISRGGEYSGLYTKESAFIISILDTEDKSYLETIYEWDQTCSSFVNLDEKESIIEPNNIPFKNNEKFIKEFFCDNQGLKASCLDYFVFPELLNKTNDYEEKISNIKITEGEFFESLKKNMAIRLSQQTVMAVTELPQIAVCRISHSPFFFY